MGVGTEAIQKLGLPSDAAKRELGIVPVCYAVTYIFGTLGTVIILGNFGPRLLSGVDKVKALTAELEKKLQKSDDESDPALINAKRHVAYRTYLVSNRHFATPRTVADTEKYLR